MFKLVSLFTGSGGFDLGFLKTNMFEVVLANDFDEFACESYRLNVGEVEHCDIKSLTDIPKADVLIGGPPCQGFSTANPERSLSDPRNWLFKEYFRVLEIASPKVFIMENVSGMKTLAKGEVLKIILKEIADAGYNAQWQILNAHDYGVPQKRRRLIIVGTADGLKFDFPDPTGENKTVGDVLLNPFVENDPCHLPMIGKLSSLNAERLQHIPQGGSMKDCPEHLRNNSDHKRAMRRLDLGQPSPTIVHNNCDHYYHPTESRRVTIREMARLQGYPDDYIFKGSKGEQSRQVGNSVPVSLAYNLALSIIKTLERKG